LEEVKRAYYYNLIIYVFPQFIIYLFHC